MRAWIVGAAGLSLVATASSGLTTDQPQTSDICKAALQPSIDSLRTDVSFQVAYLSSVNESSFDEAKRSGSIEAIFQGGYGAGDWNEFQASRRDYLRRVRLNANYEFSNRIYSSKLEGEQLRTFVDCITRTAENQQLIAYVSTAAPHDLTITARVRSPVGVPRNYRVLARVAGGGSSGFQPQTVTGSADLPISVIRTPGQVTVVNITLQERAGRSRWQTVSEESISVAPHMSRELVADGVTAATTNTIQCGGYGNRDTRWSSPASIRPGPNQMIDLRSSPSFTYNSTDGGDCGGARATSDVQYLELNSRHVRFQNACVVHNAECQSAVSGSVSVPLLRERITSAGPDPRCQASPRPDYCPSRQRRTARSRT